jgi:hypothetical protein
MTSMWIARAATLTAAGLLLTGCGTGGSAMPGDTISSAASDPVTGPTASGTGAGAGAGTGAGTSLTAAPGGSTSGSGSSTTTAAAPPTGPRTVVATGTRGVTGSGAPVPWSTASAQAPSRYPSAAPGAASLTILLDDGFGTRTTWSLTCTPDGGTHPTPAIACGVLGAAGAKSLPEVAEATMCTQLYGGPEKVRITGTWRGKPVDSQQTREDGCQIDRWNALVGLLPPGSETP